VLNEFKHYAMKAYGGVDVQIHIFLTSALAVAEWSASRSGRSTLGERAPGTHWIGGWVDPRADLDNLDKRKFFTLPGLELRPLSRPFNIFMATKMNKKAGMHFRCMSLERLHSHYDAVNG
jgi:hypothetical protein